MKLSIGTHKTCTKFFLLYSIDLIELFVPVHASLFVVASATGYGDVCMVIPLPQLVKISHSIMHTICNDPSQVIELYYSAITTAKSVIHALVLPTTVVVGFCLLMLFPVETIHTAAYVCASF